MHGMNRLRSRKNIAIIVVAFAAAAGAGATIAVAQDSPSSKAESYLNRVATHLGVSTDELKDALKAGALDEVDAAVEDGRLTQEEADELREHIESGEVPPFLGPLIGPRFEHFPDRPALGVAPFFFFEENLTTAADYLGLTEDELQERLNGGNTLADLAEAEGKSVEGLKQALVDAARERIDQAVEDGDLTRAEADRLLEGLVERIGSLVDHACFRFHQEAMGLRLPPGGPFS
jgi:hypothetical protein